MSQDTNQPIKAVVLTSGGLDSATVLAMAASRGRECYALSFDYGQRHRAELLAADRVSKSVPGTVHKVVSLDLSSIGGSALTDTDIAVPTSPTEGIPVTYVPARNTVFLSIALGWAEVLDAQEIYIGVNAVDYSGYPDCRPSYYKAMNELIKQGTKCGDIEVVTPIIQMEKPEIIQTGLDLQAPIHWSWSCYARGDKACGVCDSCALRLRAFQRLNMKDPIDYVTRPNYLS